MGGAPGAPASHSSALGFHFSLEAEGLGDHLGALPALAVFRDPDLASPEDPVRERAQCHPLPWPVHPGAATVLQLPSTRSRLGARLRPIPE